MNCVNCGTECVRGQENRPQWVCSHCRWVNWNGDVDGRCLSVDFDGTIHRYSRGWCDGRIYDPPFDDAILAMKTLQHRGWCLIVCTVRDDLKSVEDWLSEWWVAETCVWQGRLCTEHPIPEVTNYKPGAVAYIDDRAFKFKNWEGVLSAFGHAEVPK